jgi:predicted aldo/keto reductase-like oxidoreductase
MRHALDSGINFYDLADQYGTNPYFARAMHGVSRDKYVIQTKLNSRDAAGARADIDRILRELKTDYVDSLLIHCVTEADWTTRFRGVIDAFEEAKKAGKIRAHGVTCHSFEALQAAYASDWVQVNMVRWNPRGAHMDSNVKTAGELFKKMRAKGQGMIGMKVVGQGDIVKGGSAASPEECVRFQVESGVVDAFVVGVRDTQQIDQLLRGTQLALNEVGYRGALA